MWSVNVQMSVLIIYYPKICGPRFLYESVYLFRLSNTVTKNGAIFFQDIACTVVAIKDAPFLRGYGPFLHKLVWDASMHFSN